MNNREKQLVVETCNRDSIIHELKIYFKTDSITKTWSKPKYLPIQTEFITSARKPVALSSIVQEKPGFNLFQFEGDRYYFLLDDTLKPVLEDTKGSHLPYQRFNFKSESESLTVSILPPLSLGQRLNLNLFCDHLSTDSAISNKIDYVLKRVDIPPKNSFFKEDYSVWDIENRLLETEEEFITFIVLRRMYLPPDAQKYQDIIFERRYFKKFGELGHDALVTMILSLNPVPQPFLFDNLLIRSKLESLNGDEDFYTWTRKILGLKLELLPLNTSIESTKWNRCDVFCKSLAKVVGITECAPHVTQSVDDVFKLEADIISNCDSPDTILHPSEFHVAERRFKLAQYLAHYSNGIFDANFTITHLVAASEANQMVDNVISYFLHLHKLDHMFSFMDSIKSLVDIHEKTNNVEMNYQFLIKLIQTDYFERKKSKLGDHTLAKLLVLALKNIKDISTLVDLCKKIRVMKVESLISYAPFLDSLSMLLRSSENSILFAVCNCVAGLSMTNTITQQWIVSNYHVMISHLNGNRIHPRLVFMFAHLIHNSLSKKESIEKFVDLGGIKALLSCLNVKIHKNSSNNRLESIEMILHVLWVLSSDEIVSSYIVESNAIITFLEMLKNTLKIEIHVYIFGILMFVSNFDSLKEELIKFDMIPSIFDIMKADLENQFFVQNAMYSKFAKNVFGTFLFLSGHQKFLNELKSLQITEFIENLATIDTLKEEDKNIEFIVEKLNKHLV